MTLLRSRWKSQRKWDARVFVLPGVAGAACLLLVYLACSLPGWLKQAATVAFAPLQNDKQGLAAAELPKPDIALPDSALTEQFDGESHVCGYSFVLPRGYSRDVLPQPGDVPRGGRFTGLRFRGPLGHAAQLRLIVIDYPEPNSHDPESSDANARLRSALDRFFARLTHNAAMVRLEQGEVQFGDLHGMPFAKVRFAGNFREEGHRTRVRRYGVAVVTVEDKRDVYFFSLREHGVPPKALELLEATLVTLRPEQAAATR